VTSTDTKTTAFGEINTRWRVAVPCMHLLFQSGLERLHLMMVSYHTLNLSPGTKKIIGLVW
jgi:hypothetical protein